MAPVNPSQSTVLDLKTLRAALRDPDGRSFQGKTFNRYDLLSEIARGGMGIVFRAKHRELGSLVALKLLAQADPSPEAVARFRREARVLAKIKHPNVVGISDLGEDSGIAFLAMELIEGTTLQNLVEELRKKKELPTFAQAIATSLAIAKALAHCHDLGAVHRDVKPHNILIERETQRAVLTDFGLVKRDEAKMGQSASITAGVSQAGKILGTPSYMAPEQFEPEGPYGKVGPKTDVWGLGAVLFYALTGVPPFQASNVVDLYGMVVGKPVAKPSQLRPGIPEALDTLVLDCLAKKVDERLSMPEVVKRLELLEANAALLKPKGASSGVAQALILIGVILALAGIHVTVIQPEQGQRLWALFAGEADAGPAPETPPTPPSPGPDPEDAAGGETGPEPESASEVQGGGDQEVAALRVQADNGDVQAMLRLGTILRSGREGVPADLPAAYALFLRAAEAGDSKAMVFVGQLLEQGRGAPHDPAAAVAWFRKAAERDNPSAMLWLGHLYKAGFGEQPADAAVAVDWFRRAAELAGRSPGQESLRDKAQAELDALLAANPGLGAE